MSTDPVADLERWRDHGAHYRVLELGDDHAVVELCTCYGEPVDRLESDDPALIAYLLGSTGRRRSANSDGQIK